MAIYMIREENIERLEKKLAAIQKKCEATHCSFTCRKIGDHFKEDKSGNIYKYIEVEVEGTAQYNGWRFVATLDHHEEGNVIRAYDTDLVIPDKYKSCGPTCEHCNKIRSRKDTYLIYNDEKSEFKQVGKSCLQEFTSGLSAEDVAFFCSIYEKCEEGGSYSGLSDNRYIEVEGILRYAFECVKHWGYHKADATRSTKERVTDYYYMKRAFSAARDKFKAEMNQVEFNPDSDYAKESTEKALEWIRNIDDTELIRNEYLRNLHVICSEDYTDYRSLGILVSLTVAYERHLRKIEEYKERQEAQEEMKKSKHVGEKGDKVEIKTDDFTFISYIESIYGGSWLYKFSDGTNIFSWFSSKQIDNTENVVTVKGTIKGHSEFNGIKETTLTRCKVEYRKEEKLEAHPAASSKVDHAITEFLNYCNS